MNILAGKFGGRKIKTNKKLQYRPTKSRVRKSIFDTLMPFNYNRVLDLFSGSGIFGFEAASRGARMVTFVENDRNTFNLIKQNAELLPGVEYDIFRNSSFNFLKNNKILFDLVYADPPYGKYDLSKLSELILKHLNNQGKFILECEKKQVPLIDTIFKDYGQTRIYYWEKK